MPEINVTFQSNLTASANGSTITGASTSKLRSTSSTTAQNMTAVTQLVSTTDTAIDLGAVDITKSFALRLRNLEAIDVDAPGKKLMTVSATIGAADRVIGYIRHQSTFGPIDVPGAAWTGVKIKSATTEGVVEIIAVQTSESTT